MTCDPTTVRRTDGDVRQTRRAFLGSAGMAAGAAIAAPYVITSTALGNATTPPASDRIVMGGIGIGNQGSGDQKAFLGRADVQYVALSDVRTRWRDEAKDRVDKKYGNSDCKTYLDFRDLLARPDIDAVHIATPDHWHAIMSIAACQAGKDIYLQKPETLTLREGPLMIAAARRYNRVLSGGSQRVLEDYRSIVDPCWAGEIGRITSIDLKVGPPSMACYLAAEATPPDVDWDLWLGPAPWEPYNAGRIDGNYGANGNSWRSYTDYSGGSLTDWGAHNFGGLIFAADMLDLQPTRATYHPASADGKEAAWVTLAFPNGTEVHANRPERLQPKPTISHAERGIQIVGDGVRQPPKPVPQYSGSGGIYGDFIECVKTRERPFRDIERGVNTMVSLHLLLISQRLQRSLEWDRAAQRFIGSAADGGDAEANRMLDRSRREPWIL